MMMVVGCYVFLFYICGSVFGDSVVDGAGVDGRFSGNVKNETISRILAIRMMKIPMTMIRVTAPMKLTNPVVLNRSTLVCSAMLL